MNKHKLIPLVVAAAGLLAYHNSFTAPFMFDDVLSIRENPTIRHLWPIWQPLSPPTIGANVGGRPVTNLSLAVNYALGGYNVWGYHALNLAVHILAGLTLLGVVRRTLRQPALRERFGAVANELALAVAVLWTVHPLQTESVTYLSQRAESLMGLFYLLTLYCFIRGTASPRAGLWFTLSIVVCLLGMATKEVMVTAPVMVLLYDRTFVAGSFRSAWMQRRRLYIGLGGTWILLAYLLTSVHNRGVGYGFGITWQAYALTGCRSIVHYLWLAIWPHPLVIDYGRDIIWQVTDAAPYALILLLLAAGVVIGLTRWPAIGFLGAWLLVILAPTSSVVPVALQPMAEHRMYLPLAAVVVLGAMGIHALVGRRTVVVATVLAIGLGYLTWRRNQDYRSELAIWSDTVAKWPGNPRAQYNLGVVLEREGRLVEAIGRYEQALQLQPDYGMAHENLGEVLARTGRIQEAIGHYQQALRIKPDYAEAHGDLGLALMQSGRIPEAIEHLEYAVRLKPELAEAHCNLGVALQQAGKLSDAIGQFERAVQLKPEYVEAHNSLGLALMQSGRIPEAIEHFEHAVRLKPGFAEAQCNLGIALCRAGKIRDAIGHFEEALRLKPDSPEVHVNFGLVLELAGKTNEAISHYEQALRFKPDYAQAQKGLARLRAAP